jgi:hypothetical protein
MRLRRSVAAVDIGLSRFVGPPVQLRRLRELRWCRIAAGSPTTRGVPSFAIENLRRRARPGAGVSMEQQLPVDVPTAIMAAG